MFPASRAVTPPRGSLGHLDLRCPPLPQTLTQAVELMAEPERIECADVAVLVERDPALLAYLLRSVNSAYYGLGRTITSPARAVLLLGPMTVVQLAAGMGLGHLRSAMSGPARAVADAIVRHSLATAHLAQRLAEAVDSSRRPAQSGEAYTAGLLHDFGKLVLLHNFPDEGKALYGKGALDGLVTVTDAREHERLLFGFDHAEAGAIAAERLGLPEALARVLRLHHDPTSVARPGDPVGFLLRVTAAASYGATLLGASPNGTPPRGIAAAVESEGPVDETAEPLPSWAAITKHDLPEIGGAAGLLGWFGEASVDLGRYLSAVAPAQRAPAQRAPLRLAH